MRLTLLLVPLLRSLRSPQKGSVAVAVAVAAVVAAGGRLWPLSPLLA